VTELSTRKRLALKRARAFRHGRGDAPEIRLAGEWLSLVRGRRWAAEHRARYGPMGHQDFAWFGRTLRGVALPGDSEKCVAATAHMSPDDSDSTPDQAKHDL
jgi:hypothetical protein